MSEPFPQWVLIFERIGPGSCVLLFTGACLWKLLPAVVKLLGAWRKQSEAAALAIPRFESKIQKLIDVIEVGICRLPQPEPIPIDKFRTTK